jgi:dienelactone hydrolase
MTCSLVLLAVALGPAADPPNLEERARALVTALAKDDFAAASKDFDDTMKKGLPPDKLGDAWKETVKLVGAFKKQGAATAEKKGQYDIVWVACEFEKATWYTKAVFDDKGRVTGLLFTPTGPAGEYKAPAYVKRDSFQESAATVGAGEWALPATLTLPKGDGPFPGVVLVHGSGPNDRDETVGPNRPFRDLAWGLASQGIAVLRYEKRTKEHGAKFAKAKDATVKEEVLDDALAAVALLRKTKGIDGKRVFVLGHSLGAMAAPKMGERDAEIAGLILMAAPSRDMADVLLEQLDYVLSVNPSEAQKAAVAKLKAQAEKLKDPKLSSETPAEELPFGGTAAYWLSVRDLRPVETAAKVKQPLLILQGGRDYQSTMTDFDGWKKALSDRKGVTLKSYPKLNHLFAEGEGEKAKPAEYLKEGHVAKEVVDDVAAWVRKR